MDKLFGLPAHPLLIHIPVALLPLAAIGVVMMAMKPEWHHRYRWVVLGIGAAGAIGSVLAAAAGEDLEGIIVAREGEAASAGWEHHAQLGETARNVAVLFLIVLAVFVLLPWWQERQANANGGSAPTRKGLRIAIASIAVVAAVGSVVTVVLAGHSGSKSVWEETVNPPAAG